MSLSYEKNILLNILQHNSNMGKTAVMKVIFMLQQVKGMSLGYDFSIYTYGPYSSDVTEDVDDLISIGLIKSTMYPYHSYIGYELNIAEKGKSHIEKLSTTDEKAVADILDFIKGKSAKDLELYSTIVYVDNLYTKNLWKKDTNSIIKKVKEIKPHFEEVVISEAFQTLKTRDYLAS
jgi:uncharacterized protein YwgA